MEFLTPSAATPHKQSMSYECRPLAATTSSPPSVGNAKLKIQNIMIIGNPGMASEGGRQSQVNEWKSRLFSEARENNELVEKLREKFAPVLRDERPKSGVSDEKGIEQSGLVPVAEELRQLHGLIYTTNTHIRAILATSEL